MPDPLIELDNETHMKMFVLSLLVIPFLTLVPFVLDSGVPSTARIFAAIAEIAIAANFIFWMTK